MPRKIEISHKTILFTLAVLAGSWVILQIRDILYLLFISFILMTALRPLVDGLNKVKIPRVISIIFVYIVIFGGIGSVIATLVPTISVQSGRLMQELPGILRQLAPNLDINLRAVTQEIAPIGQNILRVGIEIVNNIVTVVSILVFTFYLLLGRSQVKGAVSKLAGDDMTDQIFQIINDVEDRLGSWVRGQILLMVTIGISVYIGLTILHVEYALPLALLSGLLEVVPMIGPIVGAVPGVLLALTISPLFALSVAALYFLIQQLENHIIVPWVMKKSVGLSPILTIVAIMIGAKFEGIIGALLAIPAILVVQVIASHLITKEHPHLL